MCWGFRTLLSSQEATLQSGASAGRTSRQPGTCADGVAKLGFDSKQGQYKRSWNEEADSDALNCP
jgi:hypothetical protein